MSSGALETACAAGLLEPPETSALGRAPRGAAAADDFISGGIAPCGVASLAWSSVLLVDTAAFKGAAPKTLAEAFDVRRFPGKRALPRSPRHLLEAALMAEGVAPADVYRTLATEDGLKRAIDRARAIHPHTVWWDNAGEAVKHLREKRVVIALAYSGRAFQEFATSVYDLTYWAVPKAARHKEAAREFIAFATEPERLAATARHFPYGPARQSAVALVGRHAVLGIELGTHLPTAPENMTRALRFDAVWWLENEARVTDLFNAMLNETGAASAKAAAPPPGPTKAPRPAKKPR